MSKTFFEEMGGTIHKSKIILSPTCKYLKAENQMQWVQKMKNIYNRAAKIVNTDLIYI